MTNIVLLIFLNFATASADVFRPEGVQRKCETFETPLPWSYCLYMPTGNKGDDLIYHFHGRNGDPDWWNDEVYYVKDVYKTWLSRNQRLPTVVSVSFGKLWLLIEDPQLPNGGLFDFFAKSVVQEIESHLPTIKGDRMLFGESMGGLNSLLVALKTQGLFAKVAALCPPLPTISPFSSWFEMVYYVLTTSVTWEKAKLMRQISQRFFKTEEDWQRNDPIHLSKTFNPEVSPSLFLNCGKRDDWGCLKGSESIVSEIRQRGGSIQWQPRPGGHCDIEPTSLAEFLLP